MKDICSKLEIFPENEVFRARRHRQRAGGRIELGCSAQSDEVCGLWWDYSIHSLTYGHRRYRAVSDVYFDLSPIFALIMTEVLDQKIFWQSHLTAAICRRNDIKNGFAIDESADTHPQPINDSVTNVVGRCLRKHCFFTTHTFPRHIASVVGSFCDAGQAGIERDLRSTKLRSTYPRDLNRRRVIVCDPKTHICPAAPRGVIRLDRFNDQRVRLLTSLARFDAAPRRIGSNGCHYDPRDSDNRRHPRIGQDRAEVSRKFPQIHCPPAAPATLIPSTEVPNAR